MARMLNRAVARAGSASGGCRGSCAPGCTRRSRLLRAPAGRTDVLRRARDGQPLYWGLDVVFWDNEKEQLLTRRSAPRASASTAARRPAMLVDGVYADLLARQPERRFAAADVGAWSCRNRLPELLLMRVDKLSMAHSIEARAPFLDRDAGGVRAVAAAAR